MELTILFDHRFCQDGQGTVFSLQNYNYRLFAERYLAVFDSVQIIARVRETPMPRPPDRATEGKGIRVLSVGDWHGSLQYLRHYRSVSRMCREVAAGPAAVLMIAPGTLGHLARKSLQSRRHPYAVEVVGDPWDVFSPGTVRHPLRPVFRRLFAQQLRSQCAGACAVAYVTERTLQERYPAAPGAFATHCSDVVLDDTAFVAEPARTRNIPGRIRLIAVGTLAQLYKAHDVLLQAVAQCVHQGLDLELAVVGDGGHRGRLERQAASLGLTERVFFRGQLPAGGAVREELDRADLFVLPSKTEGLPRAMIEALARALPCIGSTVGGIPELLPPEDMVPPGDVAALAGKIREVVGDPQRRQRMATRNLRRAADFRSELLRQRHREFCQFLRQRTEQWINRQHP